MSKRCVFVAMSSQKGGVGKSTMTVLLAGYFHYVMGYNVAVVDCDYPQFSIKALRSRDTQNVEKERESPAYVVRTVRPDGQKGVSCPYQRSGQGTEDGTSLDRWV